MSCSIYEFLHVCMYEYNTSSVCLYVCMYVCIGGSDEFLRGYQVKPLTSSSVLDEQVRVLVQIVNKYV